MAEVLELSTTEIVALARGLGAPLPAFARPASGEAWNDATAQEIADIGVQTLAARDLVRPSQGALAVPAQLAAAVRTLADPLAVCFVAHVHGVELDGVGVYLGKKRSVVHRHTTFGNHQLKLIATADVAELVASACGIPDAAVSSDEPFTVSGAELASARADLEGDASALATAEWMHRHGVQASARPAFGRLAAPSTRATVFQFMERSDRAAAAGEVLSWFVTEDDGIWRVEPAGDPEAEVDGRSLVYSPVSGAELWQAVQAALGIP